MKSLSTFLICLVLGAQLSFAQSTSSRSANVEPQRSKIEQFLYNLFGSGDAASQERKRVRKEKRAYRKKMRLIRNKQRAMQAQRRTISPQKRPVVSTEPVKPVVKKIVPDCSLYNHILPQCYYKRDKSVLNIALVFYGTEMKLSDLDRLEPILLDRFERATKGLVTLNIAEKKIIPYKHKISPEYKFKNIKDKKRLQRIWYYDNVNSKIMNEVYTEYIKTSTKEKVDKIDVIAAITGAQFDGLGYASGRLTVTEYPREIAWNLDDGGRVDYISDYDIVDELIHEIGHNLGLGHVSDQCQKRGLTLEQKEACCANSPGKDDVLSYCRSRSDVNENYMHGFESCNLEMIRESIVPALLDGKSWHIENRLECK